MKKLLGLVCLMTATMVFAGTAGGKDYGYLKKEDQQYYKNDTYDGNNQRERLDSTVKEINKVYGELAAMKTEMAQMKQEIELLKSKK